MRVVALVERRGHVCSRYRIEAFAGALADRGLRLEVVPLGNRLVQRLRALGGAACGATVILQRRLLPLWQLVWLRRRAGRLIYDFDDAVFQRDSFASKPPASLRRQLRFWATVYAADLVMAGNDYLARRAAAYTEADRVHRVPTCVDPRKYDLAEHRAVGAEAQLVWIGHNRTLKGLARAAPHWTAVGQRLPGISLRLICDATRPLPGLRVLFRRWSPATEAQELARADIGVSWMPDDQWSRGKCGLKVLQYMAAGLPVVANPVGCHRHLVVHGRTGLLASTPQQWSESIQRLAADPALRRRLGWAARRRVEAQYSVQRWGPRVGDLVAGDLASGLGPGHRAPGQPPRPEQTGDESFPFVRAA